jgi:hypothetical protein
MNEHKFLNSLESWISQVKLRRKKKTKNKIKKLETLFQECYNKTTDWR